MGRKEKWIDPDEGPVQAFADELRRLRERAGRPTYRTMSRKAHRSPSALSAAAGGQRLPTLDVTLDYVRACDGDPREFERRWHEVSAALAEARTREPAPPDPSPLAADEPADVGPFRRRWRRLVLGLAGAVVLLAASAFVASRVFAPPPEPIDLIGLAELASWRSGSGPLQWGGGTRIESGTANVAREAPLENGIRMPTVLAIHPQWVPQGFVEGDFPLPRSIHRGDRFIASVGFFTDESCFAQGCRINGEVDFVVSVADRRIHTVHDIAADGATPRIDLDLSPYAGATSVRIRVDAGETAAQDWAGWWDLKIVNR